MDNQTGTGRHETIEEVHSNNCSYVFVFKVTGLAELSVNSCDFPEARGCIRIYAVRCISIISMLNQTVTI